MERTRHIYAIIQTVLFLMIISVVIVNNTFPFYIPPKILKMEKRMIAPQPVPDLSFLDPYPKNYTRFFEDRFPFRTDLIRFYAGEIGLGFFHQSPYPKLVSIGKNGYFFFMKEKPFYDGSFPMKEENIKRAVAEIHNRALFFHKQGIPFYLAIPPMKQDIYPEFLPYDYIRVKGSTPTEKIIAQLGNDSLIRFIDLKSALLKAKGAGEIYYKTDNHWNYRGGYYGYRTILERIKQDFPALLILDTADFTLKDTIVAGKNLAEIMNIKDYTKEVNAVPHLKLKRSVKGKLRGYKARPGFSYPSEFEIVREVHDPSLPKIVIVRDSYFYSLMPYIIENFRTTLVLYDTRRYDTFEEIMKKEKPDLVLYVIYEPQLQHLAGFH